MSGAVSTTASCWGVSALGPRIALLLFSLTVCFRWCFFLSGELRPATRLGHLRMGVLHHHHAFLWDFCLRVFRHVRRYNGGAGERRLPGTCWERTQDGCAGRARFALTTTSTPTWKHVHAVASWHTLMPHSCLILFLSNSSLNYSFPAVFVWRFEMNQASAAAVQSGRSSAAVYTYVKLCVSEELVCILHIAQACKTKFSPCSWLCSVTIRGAFWEWDHGVLVNPMASDSDDCRDAFRVCKKWRLLDSPADSITVGRCHSVSILETEQGGSLHFSSRKPLLSNIFDVKSRLCN